MPYSRHLVSQHPLATFKYPIPFYYIYEAKETHEIHSKANTAHLFSINPLILRNLKHVPAIYLHPAGQAGVTIIRAMHVPLRHQVILVPEC